MSKARLRGDFSPVAKRLARYPGAIFAEFFAVKPGHCAAAWNTVDIHMHEMAVMKTSKRVMVQIYS